MVCVAATWAPAALCERSAEEPVSYKFDRRRGRRLPAPCSMPATYSDGEGRFGVTCVEVVDAGPAGMGLRAACFVEPGMTVSLHTPGCRFPAVTAKVVRCIPSDDGFRIGLSTRPERAA